MFGVALSIKPEDFKNLLKNPKAAIVGIISQFILLPALTFLLIKIIDPYPSIALGMMLIAACPGGNISNFMTHLANGNTALSVSLTTFSSVAAIFLTPFNFSLWANLYTPTANLLTEINLNVGEVFFIIFFIIGIPLALGLFVNTMFPNLAAKMSEWLKPFSIIIFLTFVVIAFSNNIEVFMTYIHVVVLIVFIHNAIALMTGYFAGELADLSRRDKRTLAIETGIQNSGLGLVLIFTFFSGLGGMAIVAAWWGIWHIISGILIASLWSFRRIEQAPVR